MAFVACKSALTGANNLLSSRMRLRNGMTDRKREMPGIAGLWSAKRTRTISHVQCMMSSKGAADRGDRFDPVVMTLRLMVSSKVAIALLRHGYGLGSSIGWDGLSWVVFCWTGLFWVGLKLCNIQLSLFTIVWLKRTENNREIRYNDKIKKGNAPYRTQNQSVTE